MYSFIKAVLTKIKNLSFFTIGYTEGMRDSEMAKKEENKKLMIEQTNKMLSSAESGKKE